MKVSRVRRMGGRFLAQPLRAATVRDGFAEGGESTESVARGWAELSIGDLLIGYTAQYYVSQPTRAGEQLVVAPFAQRAAGTKTES